jgi:LysM repeat protein
MCFIKKLRMEAGSPYYDGWKLAKESVYESKTASCKVTGMPLVISTLPGDKPGSTTAPAPTTTAGPAKCAGKTYSIKGGDTCQSVAAAQGITTGWLLLDNELSSCSEFPSSDSLCLVNTCKTYKVQKDDKCEDIAQKSNITKVQFQNWNPVSVEHQRLYSLADMLSPSAINAILKAWSANQFASDSLAKLTIFLVLRLS